MGVPTVKSCCCCVSLSTGSIVIGYLYTVLAAFELCVYLLIVSMRPLNSGSGDHERSSLVIYSYFVASAVVSAIMLFCGVLLIIGTTKRRASFMLPWTITVGIVACFYFVLALLGSSMVIQAGYMGDETIMVAIHFIRACISFYCIMVVHSLHKEIMNSKSMRAKYRAVRTLDV